MVPSLQSGIAPPFAKTGEEAKAGGGRLFGGGRGGQFVPEKDDSVHIVVQIQLPPGSKKADPVKSTQLVLTDSRGSRIYVQVIYFLDNCLSHFLGCPPSYHRANPTMPLNLVLISFRWTDAMHKYEFLRALLHTGGCIVLASVLVIVSRAVAHPEFVPRA